MSLHLHVTDTNYRHHLQLTSFFGLELHDVCVDTKFAQCILVEGVVIWNGDDNRKDKKTGQEINNDGFEGPVRERSKQSVTSSKIRCQSGSNKCQNQLRMF